MQSASDTSSSNNDSNGTTPSEHGSEARASNEPQAVIRYVAIGDSFTEGVGDEQADGSVRGWADLVAQGIADAVGEPIQYANLAIRGKLLTPIIAEQLEPALALGPTLVSFNGGGNDMLRPGTNIPMIIERTEGALRHILESGAVPLLLAGADPTAGIPGGKKVHTRGTQLAAAADLLASRLGISYANNWADRELAASQYWSPDRLHLAPVGHRRVAANTLRTLGYAVPADWVITAESVPRPGRREQLQYLREHVAPWVKRRLTGRSSGDGRQPKHAQWHWVLPRELPGAHEPHES